MSIVPKKIDKEEMARLAGIFKLVNVNFINAQGKLSTSYDVVSVRFQLSNHRWYEIPYKDFNGNISFHLMTKEDHIATGFDPDTGEEVK